MALSRQKVKSRKERGSFIAIPKVILESDQYAALKGNAVKLLIDLSAQYNGSNNGDLCAAWSVMKKRGWRSKGTLHNSIIELISAGFILLTRQGGRHRPSLYAVSFKSVDDCGGKLETKPTVAPPNTWKQIKYCAPYEGQCTPHEGQSEEARAG